MSDTKTDPLKTALPLRVNLGRHAVHDKVDPDAPYDRVTREERFAQSAKSRLKKRPSRSSIRSPAPTSRRSGKGAAANLP
jgi:hypothetical protein